MKPITINFLQHRRNFLELFFYILNRVKPENREKLHINFLMTDHFTDEMIQKYNCDISYTIYNFGGNLHSNNYRDKMIVAMKNSGPYFVKLDEDIILSNHVWDYIVENVHLLDQNDDLLLLTPSVNIGVPTTDIFIESFCTPEQKAELHKIFLQQDLQQTAGNRWGEDFRSLNANTIETQKWNPNAHWHTVSQLSTRLKGVHPVRVSLDAQLKLIEMCIDNIPKFMDKHKCEVITNNWPYLCNDMSIILTRRLQDIFNEKNFDPYDEIPTNLYKQERGLKYGYINHGYAIHTMFAFVSYYIPDRHNYERVIYERIMKKIKEYCYYDL